MEEFIKSLASSGVKITLSTIVTKPDKYQIFAKIKPRKQKVEALSLSFNLHSDELNELPTKLSQAIENNFKDKK